MNLWEELKALYFKEFGISGEVLDYIAVFDILKLIALGMSNLNIGVRLHLDESYISEVAQEFYHFEGWKSDLAFYPLLCYNKTNDYHNYKGIATTWNEKLIDLTWDICKRFCEIEREVLKYGESA
jgi:hypothetical protein